VTGVSRELIRAVLEVRDRRHNETHAALVGIYQSLVAELAATGMVSAARLAARLDGVRDAVAPEVHGEAARSLVAHITHWLQSVEPERDMPLPTAWTPPGIPGPYQET